MQEAIVTSVLIEASQAQVWNVITNPNEMRQWFFASIQNFKPQVDFQTSFKVQNEDRIFTHIWQVEEVVPMKRIAYNWSYKEYEGNSVVVFELNSIANKTQLTVTHTTLEPFTADIPEFKLESGVNGWNYLIKTSLYNYLNSN